MKFKKLTLKNFRKFKALDVEFNDCLNILIGENDSGKTAIIDAIKYLLNTKSYEQVRFEPKDFYKKDGKTNRLNNFEIIGIINQFSDEEAGNFLEWGYFNENEKFELRLYLKATLQSNNRIIWELKAGPLNAETQLDGNARELLKTTYLKPLRDAESELTPGYHSRLAQILLSHKSFEKKETEHELETIFKEANKEIAEYLKQIETSEEQSQTTILEQINNYIEQFLHSDDNRKAEIKVADPELHKILRTLSLELEENTPGLGSLNKLFMAAELLHLETDPSNSIRLCIIEELEAHLHPQAQLRIINALNGIKNTQFILTTHSTTLGSSINLNNLILCKDNDAFPMWKNKTLLANGDYKFLERFLDSTKANLFFAKGIIMVEGDAENILIPTIAEIIGKPLHKYGISIVNVGCTAFLRYANIFLRKDKKNLNIPVSVVTDLDIRAMECYSNDNNNNEPLPDGYRINESSINEHDITALKGMYYTNKDELKDAIKNTLKTDRMPVGVNSQLDCFRIKVSAENINEIREAKKKTIESKFKSPIKAYVNNKWTLEYDIALSKDLRIYFAQAVLLAKRIKNSDNYFTEIYDDTNELKIPDEIQTEAMNLCDSSNDEKIAYKIFKPFLSKNKPSKAVTAQIFAEILKQNKSTIKSVLELDKNIEYIISAIKYASGEKRM